MLLYSVRQVCLITELINQKQLRMFSLLSLLEGVSLFTVDSVGVINLYLYPHINIYNGTNLNLTSFFFCWLSSGRGLGCQVWRDKFDPGRGQPQPNPLSDTPAHLAHLTVTSNYTNVTCGLNKMGWGSKCQGSVHFIKECAA